MQSDVSPKPIPPGVTLELRLSASKNLLKRESETIWAVLGDIGGFYDILCIAGNLLLSFYCSTIFENHIGKNSLIDQNMLEK